MMDIQYAHSGFFIAAELDLNGYPTGRFFVISSDGQVVHVAESFDEALKWVDEQTSEPSPFDGPSPSM